MRDTVFEIDPISGEGLDEAIERLEYLETWMAQKANELCERCASIGAMVASIRFARVPYEGPKDATVTVNAVDGGYEVRADGDAVLFLEFGSGIKYGGGHPEAGKYRMGPGKYPIPPGKGHWNSDRGWWLPKDKGKGHTYGNPPAMAMYDARKEIEERLESIVREVFSVD